MSFFSNLMISVVSILLIGGLVYWIYVFFNKKTSNIHLWIKYKLRKKQYDLKIRDYVIAEIDKGIGREDFYKKLLLTNSIPKKLIEEFMYIYDDLNKKIEMKGGKE